MKRWPLHKVHFWETAPFFRVLLPFAAGILCYDQFNDAGRYQVYFIAIVAVLLIVCAGLLIVKKIRGISQALLFVVLQTLLLFCGISVACFSNVRNDKEWFGESVGKSCTYLVRLTSTPTEKAHTWKLPVSVLSTIQEGKVQQARGKGFLYLYRDKQPMLLHRGDTMLVSDRWQLIHNAGNPFEFDYATYCRRNNTLYQQNCGVNDVRLYAANDPGSEPIAEQVHEWCMLQLDTYLKDSTTKGLIQAMLLGDEVNLDEELKQSYAATGIIHIIAISGGNVLIFFSVISFLLWWIKNKQHLWVKYALALPLVWFYVVMAGAPPSAVRAAIMFSLLAFSVMLQKNHSNLNTLFAAAFILLCGEPMWLFSVGFQLSFIAVLSLILFYKPIHRLISPTNKIARGLWSAITASIAAELLTAPLVIYYFHTFPLMFLIANVAAYVFMGVVLVLGMLIIATSFIPAVAATTGVVVVWLVTIFDRIVMWLQGFNPEPFRYLMISGVELMMIYIAIMALAAFFVKKYKAGVFISLTSCCLLLICLCIDEHRSLLQQSIIVYNTGKTNYAELISGKHYSVICADTAKGRPAYVTDATHTSLHAWRKGCANAQEVCVINGQTFLILNDRRQMKGRFPVDHLLINYDSKPDIAAIKSVFSPSVIVIGNYYSRKEQNVILKECAANGSKVHVTGNKGAYVISE